MQKLDISVVDTIYVDKNVVIKLRIKTDLYEIIASFGPFTEREIIMFLDDKIGGYVLIGGNRIEKIREIITIIITDLINFKLTEEESKGVIGYFRDVILEKLSIPKKEKEI